MTIEKVRTYFKAFGMEHRIRVFDTSSATVSLAAEALGCQPQRIAKTLCFFVGDRPVLIVTAGDSKIDNQKYKNQFGTKAKMIPAAETSNAIGYAVGGICPFAIPKEIAIYLDASLKRFEMVFPACGSSNSVIELTLKELEFHANPEAWIDVCKGWNEVNDTERVNLGI